MRKANIILLCILGSLALKDANAQTCPDENHPHKIDLGLPSGTKWACCNVGATKPVSFGGYYAWGETEEKKVYSDKLYKYPDNGSVNDIAGTKWDVAHMKWGGTWQMPTLEQLEELIENCKYQWTTQNGIKGATFTGSNGRSIFLPAAGDRDGNNLEDVATYGSYWVAFMGWLKGNHCPCVLRFSSDNIPDTWDSDIGGGYTGYSVRPVSK